MQRKKLGRGLMEEEDDQNVSRRQTQLCPGERCEEIPKYSGQRTGRACETRRQIRLHNDTQLDPRDGSSKKQLIVMRLSNFDYILTSSAKYNASVVETL
jgi:hypothetical protein